MFKFKTKSILWPGLYTTLPNWRESQSSTFTTDFFRKTEGIYSVKHIYDQISRAIIDGLDNLNFDVSEYRNQEGKYMINADKIDKLIVGERIYIDKSKKRSEKEIEPKKTTTPLAT
ncbi:MAG: hypothetical protein JSW07_12375 [bacterium]|nr:MAG: hypothetical protein JSW07_12375 [bacterium]